ncbi:hypothetical protein BDV28DRAFT_87765 [Aspergillus coremiiformis]|uniref:Uncharacterized protein n=1 Tax=Aspergillus coremiiformis TaxID=138285 RepID=A0A5N6Z9F2_9EURO|nr:hypothetical protein BDV28DRAFT_87765 [Aspergillus coremiiformis]
MFLHAHFVRLLSLLFVQCFTQVEHQALSGIYPTLNIATPLLFYFVFLIHSHHGFFRPAKYSNPRL